MGRSIRYILAILMVAGLVQSATAQEAKIDERVWSLGLQQRLVEEGRIPANPPIDVPPAIYTGSKIESNMVLVDDSPDVPVDAPDNSTQSENSIFVSPLDDDFLFQSNNSTPYPSGGSIHGSSRFFSSDGGLVWDGTPLAPEGSNCGDPAVAIDLTGRILLGFIDNCSGFGQGVAYSDDLGETWTRQSLGTGTLDKNHLWVDNSPDSPYEGHVYVAWTNFDHSNIEVRTSTDRGETWGPDINVSAGVNSGSHDQGVNIQTGPNGEVYVLWAIYDGWPQDENALGLARSFDGGATWEEPSRIIQNIRGIRSSETSKNQRVNSYPVLAADISTSSHRGNLYAVWTNIGYPGVNDGPERDIYMIRSEDGGDTWTDPIRINQDPEDQGAEHYFPWITCDPVTGDLAAIFYDDRNVGGNMVETYAAASTDGGDTWEDFKISDVAFTPAPIPGLAFGYFGDYLNIVARGGKVYPVWTDNRFASGSAMAYVSPFSLVDRPEVPDMFSVYSDYTTPTEMALNWVDPAFFNSGDTLDPAGVKIIINRDGQALDSVAFGIQNYIDSGLTDGQAYSYEVYAKIDTNGIFSNSAASTWIAGGSPVPSAPLSFSVAGNTEEVSFIWEAPSTNIDETAMDDYAGINVYRDGILVTAIERSSADTGRVDTAMYAPDPVGFYSWNISIIDNEDPLNESDSSSTIGTPLSLPFVEEFLFEGEPGEAVWSTTNVDINENSVDPPSGPYALNLNGKPDGEDIIELKPMDLSGMEAAGIELRYWFQPAGSGDRPELRDSLFLYFKNSVDEWLLIRAYPGTEFAPFAEEIVHIADEPAGSGSYFFGQFQLRLRSLGGAGTFPNDNWFIDDLSIQTPLVGIEDEIRLPKTYSVSQNYPNPFNPTTQIDFELPKQSKISLIVYDLLGQRVKTLVDGNLNAGSHQVIWDGSNDAGRDVASGIYIYRFFSDAFSQSRKMILIR